jgi:glutaredoxin
VTRVTLISRAGCHLCEVAEQALDRIAAGDWTRLDVDSSTELEREYGDRVPVVLLDGKEHGYWKVEEERLLRDMQRRPGDPRL